MKTFPSTDELLISGADPRLALGPSTGTNHYLCQPHPEPDMLRFGSSTASTIDQQEWETANDFRDKMAQTSATMGSIACRKHYHNHICNTLKTICGLDDTTAIILTESGTSTHHLAAQTVQKKSPGKLQAIMMQPSETGSGVPAALALDSTLPVHTITLRDSDGIPRLASAVESDIIQQTEKIVQQGASLLLVLVDCSKSGLTAPSLTTALDLRQRFPGQIHLLLDGCQFRFDSNTLRHYLQQGVMVAITGSKFLAGPSFSAALLLPDGNRSRSDTPAEAGVLLRWHIALSTLKSLQALDPTQTRTFIETFAQHVSQRLANDPILFPLQGPTRPGATIFPFGLRHRQTPFSMTQALTIYQQLQQHDYPKVQLGRPIYAGIRNDGEPIGALRLNLSAPLIIDAIANKQQHSVINQAMQALDRVQSCVRAQGTTH